MTTPALRDLENLISLASAVAFEYFLIAKALCVIEPFKA
jgi:hypothetical protein